MPAKSKSQQRFFGMVHAYQKGELKNAPKSVKKAAGSMTKKASKDFAKTKHKGLPEKIDEQDGDSFYGQNEFFTSGRMARARNMTLDRLRQELEHLEAEHEEAVLAGEEPEVLDDLEMEIEQLEALILDRQQRSSVNVRETFKQLTFRQYLRIDEATRQGPATPEEYAVLELQKRLMDLASKVEATLAAKTTQAKQPSPKVPASQPQQQASPQNQPQNQGKINKQIQKAVSLGPVKEGILGSAMKRASEYGARSGVGRWIQSGAERWAERAARRENPFDGAAEYQKRAADIQRARPEHKIEADEKRQREQSLKQQQQQKQKKPATRPQSPLQKTATYVSQLAQQTPNGQAVINRVLQQLEQTKPHVATAMKSLLNRAGKHMSAQGAK